MKQRENLRTYLVEKIGWLQLRRHRLGDEDVLDVVGDTVDDLVEW